MSRTPCIPILYILNQIRPEFHGPQPDLAGFRNSNPARARAGFGENLFLDHRTIRLIKVISIYSHCIRSLRPRGAVREYVADLPRGRLTRFERDKCGWSKGGLTSLIVRQTYVGYIVLVMASDALFVYTGDLSASEITMSDEDRIQLMLLVKEGKISVQEAVDTVRRNIYISHTRVH